MLSFKAVMLNVKSVTFSSCSCSVFTYISVFIFLLLKGLLWSRNLWPVYKCTHAATWGRGWIKLLQQRGGGFPSAKQAEPSELSGGQLCSDHQTTPSPPHRTVQMFTSHSPPATLQCFQRNRQAAVCSCCSDTQPGQIMSTVRTR